MCGIFITSKTEDSYDFKSVSSSLKRRGPNSSSSKSINGLTCLHTRLSIQDTNERGTQPLSDESDQYTILFNGEIYNHIELINIHKLNNKLKTKTDTEAILYLYIYLGNKIFNLLRGMFAIVIIDNKNKKIIACRDRFGIKPLYASKINNEFFLTSSISVFDFIYPEIYGNISLEHIFNHLNTVGDVELFTDIKPIKPGFIYEYNLQNLTLESNLSYGNVKTSYPTSITYNEHCSNIKKLFLRSVKNNLLADTSIGVLLSGGIDSTAIFSACCKYSDIDVTPYQLVFRDFKISEIEKKSAEITCELYNKKLKYIQVDNVEIPYLFNLFVDAIDYPSTDGFNSFLISYHTSKECKVLLSGVGGDELFMGYPFYSDILNRSYGIIGLLMGYLHDLVPSRYTRQHRFNGLDLKDCIRLQRIQSRKSFLSKRNFVQKNNTSSRCFSKISSLEINGYLRNVLLRDIDSVFGYNGQEVRPVFLDDELVSYLHSLEDGCFNRNNIGKSLLIDSIPDCVPNHVRKPQKTGFNIPSNFWLNSVLNTIAIESLEKVITMSSDSLPFRKILKNSLFRISKQKSSNIDWSIVVLCVWFCKKIKL